MAITRMKKLNTMIIFTSIGIEEKIAVMMTLSSCDFDIVFMGRIILKVLSDEKEDCDYSESDIVWYLIIDMAFW